MKIHLLAVLIGAAAAPAFAQTTVADWTFETTEPTTSGPVAADVGSGTATAVHAGASTFSSPTGNGSFSSWNSTNWTVGDYYQFQVSTLGQSGLSLSWDQASSNTGPRDFALEYSTDGGSSFTTVGGTYGVLANASPNATWSNATAHPIYTVTDNLSGIASLNNDAAVLFRLVDIDTTSANGASVASAGTDRVDNFNLTAIPEPSTYALISGLAVAAFALTRRRRRLA